MARVATSEGIPDNLPGLGSPDDYQRVQTSAATFGGEVARSAEQLGSSLTRTGQFFGQVAADNASNEFQERANKILRGDPSKTTTGPDGQPQQDLGYLGLRGRAALDARPQVEKQLDDLLKQTREGLQTPEQTLRFDSFSRQYRSHLGSQIGAHADGQANQWYGEVNNTTANLAIDHIVANEGDDTQVAAATHDLIGAKVRNAQLAGGGDVLISGAIAEGKQQAIKARVESLAPRNPQRAREILDANKADAGPLYDNLMAQVRTQADRQVGTDAARRAIADAGAGMLAPGAALKADTGTLRDAIFHQESGNRDTTGASVDGARGPAQILPATFAQYAKPGESIDNPADNRAVGERIINDLSQRFGNDPARVAVGYFSGPDNVAPVGSPTPWVRDTHDGNGQSVSGYVSQVTGRLGDRSGALTLKANAVDRILSDPSLKDNPQARQYALQEVSQQYAAAEVAASADNKARQDAQAKITGDLTSEVIKSTLPGGALDPSFFPRVAAMTQAGQITGPQAEGLYNFARKATEDAASQTAKTYGPNFSDLVRRTLLPAGDPQRIANDTDIVHEFANNPDSLKPAGVTELQRFMKMAQEQPGQAQMTEAYLRGARSRIAGLFPGMDMGDPKGEARYAAWLTYAMPTLQKAVAEGKFAEVTKEGGDLEKSVAAATPKMDEQIGDKDKPGAPVNGAPPFRFDLGAYDLRTPESISAAKQAIKARYDASRKTPTDYATARNLINSLPGGSAPPQVPVQ